MKKHQLAATLLFGGYAVAHALPQVSVSYVSPTGVATTTDSIEMWVHISADRTLSSSLGAPFGFDAADLPKVGSGFNAETNQWVKASFASYTSLTVVHGYGCSPTCEVPGYTFQAWYSGADPTRPSFMFSDDKTLKAGDYLVGSYVPTEAVQPGTYIFPVVPNIQFNVSGLSASGVSLIGDFGIQGVFEACSFKNQPACSFTRTIVSVPEAGTLAYQALGLGMLAGFAGFVRSRRRQA